MGDLSVEALYGVKASLDVLGLEGKGFVGGSGSLGRWDRGLGRGGCSGSLGPMMEQKPFESEGEEREAVGGVAEEWAGEDLHGCGMPEEMGAEGVTSCVCGGFCGVDGKAAIKAEGIEPCAQTDDGWGCGGDLSGKRGEVALEKSVKGALVLGEVLGDGVVVESLCGVGEVSCADGLEAQEDLQGGASTGVCGRRRAEALEPALQKIGRKDGISEAVVAALIKMA